MTDGAWYWRIDTADYVEHYQVALPAEFIEHMRALAWTCPTITRERVAEIDKQLSKTLCNP